MKSKDTRRTATYDVNYTYSEVYLSEDVFVFVCGCGCVGMIS